MTEQMKHMLVGAKGAAKRLATMDGATRDGILTDFANELLKNADYILEENAKDVAAAREKLGEVMVDRLKLTKQRIEGMA
ncbi:MAG: gamma-glutamyl-phosphate reductase, partial [Clostridia bacterium]|nr:gamma-glutamyl-phosphate reductase [Clostridia bacterium]